MVQVSLDGIPLKVLSIHDSLATRDVQWDSWKKEAWMRETAVFGGLRTWTITAYETDMLWLNSQVRRFQEKLLTGKPVSFTLKHEDDILRECQAYILNVEVNYDRGAKEAKKYREYTLTIQEIPEYSSIWVPSFNGVNNYVNIPDAASLQISGSFTIEVLFYLRKVPSSTASFLHKGVWPEVVMYMFGTYTGSLRHYVIISGVTNGYIYSYTNTIPLNEWSHWMIVRNDSFLGVYRNSELIQSRNDLSGTASLSTDAVQLAKYGGTYLDVIIASARLYNRALSADEVKNNFTAARNLKPTAIRNGLVLELLPKTEYKDLGTWTDQSGQNNHGTVYGTWIKQIKQ